MQTDLHSIRLLEGDHNPCDQAIRRQGGPSAYGGVRDEDGCALQEKREEEGDITVVLDCYVIIEFWIIRSFNGVYLMMR